MTQWMLATIAMAIAGQVIYQIGQRAVPRDASPFVVLALAYLVAAALCIALACAFGASVAGTKFRSALSWPTWVIALSIVAIELGFLTAYRSGWTIGTAYAVASTATLVSLAFFGRLVLSNPFSLRQLIGLVLSSLTVWLLATGGDPSAGH
jgi:multidrug transporter EmrE-like cation transporter